jgi:hypothetical protein
MNKLSVILVSTLVSLSLWAHEGHSNAPGSFKSLHGGSVQNGKELNLEIIISGKELTVYPTSHESKDVSEKDVKIVALAKPKKGKAYPLAFTFTKGAYKTTVDLQGANRLPVEITVQSHGKIDRFTIQIEE